MLRFGLFGAGRIGRVHAASVAMHPRAELAVVYDPVEAAAREVAAQYGAAPTGDAKTILGDPDIDAVIIASPTPTHVDAADRARCRRARRCSARSRSTWTWPGSTPAGRTSRAWTPPSWSASTAGSTRPSPRYVTGWPSGEIGRLEQLVITSRDPAPAPAAYIATSGGLFRDMTIHDFDMARFFLGEVVEVQAMGANLIEPYIAEAGDIDSAMVVLRGAGGELARSSTAAAARSATTSASRRSAPRRC